MAEFLLNILTGVFLCLGVQAFIEAQRLRRSTRRLRKRHAEFMSQLDADLARIRERQP